MHRSTLVVDDDDRRRRQIVQAFSQRGLRYLDVADAFGAMAALGRADFGVVVANEGRRTLSLRGLCQLARRRHPDILILVVHREGSDPAAIPEILGVPVEVLPPSTTAAELAALVSGALSDAVDTVRSLKAVQSPSTQPNSDVDVDVEVVVDDDPTVKTRLAPAPPPEETLRLSAAPGPARPAPAFDVDEPTLRLPAAPAALPAPEPLPPMPLPQDTERLTVPQLATPPSAPPLSVPGPRLATPPSQTGAPAPGLARGAPPAPPAAFESLPTAPRPVTAVTQLREVTGTPEPVRAPAPSMFDVITAPGAPFSLGADEPTERQMRSPAPAPEPPPAPAPGQSPPAAAPEALLEGQLDGATGPALLMGLFSQELTGQLRVREGPAAGTLYFYRGEPVWADDPQGDAGLHRRLVQRGRLKPDAQLERVPQGQLLGSLVQKGLLSGQQMHEFMRELVRDFVLALANAATGTYRFDEDKNFLDVAPLLKVNPFGLILESRRRSLPPPELLSLSNTIADQFVIPQPGLVSAAEKIAPFVRGARLGRIIDGTRTARQIIEGGNLDMFMGTLVLVTLRDTRLISFEDAPHAAAEGGVTLTDAALSDEPREITLVDAEIPSVPEGSSEEAAVREEIFQLYMRLKPLTVPRQVLGVGLDAGLADVEAAYQARMRELDPRRVPEGSAQQLLAARVEELARKVTSAYQAVKLQIAAGEASGVLPKARSNPF